ncbi:hypothetical protein Desti_5451 [Desulfomonile tiedjei DSM 6799]|uniref:Uncharacterized protein n=1 Tax=Desulfomonile tiedjei (strain ATCC 49306 / DSM 6799 / DCB-1) TaxID=706587 RepID=I4CEP6_DESTA|nr:hypothetical protein Desti_5451 [Desulfomonile tiedjei DSM 6799]
MVAASSSSDKRTSTQSSIMTELAPNLAMVFLALSRTAALRSLSCKRGISIFGLGPPMEMTRFPLEGSGKTKMAVLSSPVMHQLKRKPFQAQADAIQGTVETLRTHNHVMCIGEMGVGKTLIGAAVPSLFPRLFARHINSGCRNVDDLEL